MEYWFKSYRNQQATNKAPKPLTRRAVSEAFAMIGKEVNIALYRYQPR
ncbi:protein of unknown function [Moritella yayanosii]|uniref:Uncharacterized protein n=1 Tax=Moritella yayanosii TaxID=69539 RepID=A0A330LIT4_9GAMM|nr:protein of unknown function [Moritella yayanosii]